MNGILSPFGLRGLSLPKVLSGKPMGTVGSYRKLIFIGAARTIILVALKIYLSALPDALHGELLSPRLAASTARCEREHETNVLFKWSNSSTK